MRQMYQICWASHEEVMFRKEQDINYIFNCFAFGCLSTESRAVGDSEMTTHCHFGACSDDPHELFNVMRYPYTRYFDNEYGRRGSIGERKPYIMQIDGLYHMQTFCSYVFRQSLHHGLTMTPFGYKHNSVNAIFQKELGKCPPPDLLERRYMYKYLPRSFRDVPSGYRMSSNGLLLREDVIDTAYVEELYISPRNFLYQMNRKDSTEWKKEQEADRNGLPPITLENVEPACFRQMIPQFLNNDNSRSYRHDIDDLEMCGLIDNLYLPRTGHKSIYELTRFEKNDLANYIYNSIRNGEIARLLGRNPGLPDKAQISRCLALKYDR